MLKKGATKQWIKLAKSLGVKEYAFQTPHLMNITIAQPQEHLQEYYFNKRIVE